MIPQSRMPRERFIAHLAHVRPFARMDAFVVFQMWRLRELHAARVAAIRLLARVNSRMVFQIGRFSER